MYICKYKKNIRMRRIGRNSRTRKYKKREIERMLNEKKKIKKKIRLRESDSANR